MYYTIAWYGHDDITICTTTDTPTDLAAAQSLQSEWNAALDALGWGHMFASVVTRTDIDTIDELNEVSVSIPELR
jgi:hypothetical protein